MSHPSPLDVFGEHVVGEVMDVVQKNRQRFTSEKERWKALLDIGFEPIAKDGRLVAWKSCALANPDAVRCKTVRDFVLTLDSSKYNPKLPIESRNFLERCMLHGARMEDAYLDAQLRIDGDVCIICMTNLRTHTTVPCGHKKFCGMCVATMLEQGRETCPECNTKLNPNHKFVKIFE